MKKIEYCFECDKDVESIIKYEENNYTYRDKEFKVVEEVHYCPICHSELLNDVLDNSMNNIYNGYLKLFDLSFEKLKEIRTKLNLTQELMAKILGWSKKSIVRYENMESVPLGEYLNMYITLNENPFDIVKILERQKHCFEEEEYYKILKTLPFYDKYKTVNSILYLLEDNPLYETSLMKNLFTIDFKNCKDYGNPITNLKYIHMPYGPVVENRFNLYNFMLKNDYIELDATEFSNGTKFKIIFNYDKNIFDENEFQTLTTVKEKLKKYSATSLSNWSHSFKGWKETENGQIINYDYATYFNMNDL